MRNHQAPVQVNISTLTIIKVLLVGLGLVFVWAIRDVVAMVFVAWVLASALDPLIVRLQRWHIPRGVGILLVYLVAALIIALVIVLMVPPLSKELTSIAHNFPHYYQPIRDSLNQIEQRGQEMGFIGTIKTTLDNAVQGVTSLTNSLYSAIASFFGGLVMFIGILVIAFYMTVEEEGIKKFFQSILPVNYQPYIIQKLNQIQRKLSAWLWGQLVLMAFVGLLCGLALWILGVKYALVLGLLAGLTEIVPIVGPILASIPAIFFAFTDFAEAPYKPFLVMIVFIVVQQVENQLLVPKVMNRAVGLNPIIVLIALLIAGKLVGIPGIILAVPFVTILNIFLQDFFVQRELEHNKLEE